MIEEVREAVCGECIHCDACKNMMNTCSPGSIIVNFKAMPVGACPHFAGPATFARKTVDEDYFRLSEELKCASEENDALRAKCVELHDKYAKFREEHEQLLGKLKCVREDNDRMRAQLDIVHLIFGKG